MPTSPLLRCLSRPHGFEPLRIEGRLPETLRGTLYRAGPGLFERFGRRVPHPFEADGALTAVRFDGAGARGACRLVESEGYHEEGARGRFLYNSQAAWLDRMIAAARGRTKCTGNTSTMLWGGRLFALMEGGLPQEMDPDTLDTLAADDLGAVTGAFSAHPHRVASLRTTFNFGVRYGRRMMLDLYAMPDTGPCRAIGSVEAPWPGMVHDFMATDKHLIFHIGPVKLDMLRALAGIGDVTRLFRWTPELGSRLLVVPLDDLSAVRSFELDASWTWHFANGFETPDGPAVDLCRYPSLALEDIGQVEYNGPPPILTRLHVDLAAGRVQEEALFDAPCEFPQVHPRVHGGRHEAVFLRTERPLQAGREAAVVRVDLASGRSDDWVVPQGHVPSEPVLVPRGEAQDDVWVLDLVYAPESDHSYVAVLDGQAMARGPVATAHFDQPLPLSLHGSFAPGIL